MLHYLYLDYGGRAQYRRELKYSLISLRQELGTGADARIVVYTDAPKLLNGLYGICKETSYTLW